MLRFFVYIYDNIYINFKNSKFAQKSNKKEQKLTLKKTAFIILLKKIGGKGKCIKELYLEQLYYCQ